MEDEEFEKWYNSKETQDIIINELDSDEKKIARLAWQASLDLYRTEECEDCDMKNKLAPCRPAHMCEKFKKKVCKKCGDTGKIMDYDIMGTSLVVTQCDCTKVTL